MKKTLKKIINNWRWRKIHPGTQIIPVGKFDYKKVEIGRYSYGELNVVDFGEGCLLKIGNFVSIAQQVTFILNAEHNIRTISTYPYKTKMLKITDQEAYGKGDIIVADDVWIGYGATILSGIQIGQGAIIAAGAVVTKDVPPYAIVGGSPAKIISYRFSQETIDKFMHLDFSKLDSKTVESHINELYCVYSNDMDLSWFPKK